MNNNQIIVTYGENGAKMTRDVLEAANLEKKIKSGSLIGIKPNLVVAKPASSGATTSPVVVGAVIEYLKEHGHENIVIMEGSWVGESTDKAFEVCGYEELSKKYNVPLFNTKKDSSVTKTYGSMSIDICKKALEVDFLINMPVLKGHCQTMVTGALKNLKGCITDMEKRHFHTLGLHKPIALLNRILHTDFIVVDGLCGDLDFEEGGNPVKMNRIFCGTDPVLIDSYISSCMGYAPKEIDYICYAGQLGVGSMDIAAAEIIELNKDSTIAGASSSRRVNRLARAVSAKEACSACYANLIQALARLEDKGLDRKIKDGALCIGQGYKGKTSSLLGVGNCTSNFEKYVKGCPAKTEDILEFIKGYIS